MADLYGTDPNLQRVTIGSLPDDVLLDVFDIYLATSYEGENMWKWRKLVHVCRRWRWIVFASPQRLKLELRCTPKTPVRRLLDIWPELPLDVDFYGGGWGHANHEDRVANLIVALEHRDRVRRISLNLGQLTGSSFERITAVIQEPFPAMASLMLQSYPVVFSVPDTFLNASAPSLRHLTLKGISLPSLPRLLSSSSSLRHLTLMGISLPSLPRLLSSASHLAWISLHDIPNTGYFSPESMATSLSALTNLGYLCITFQSPTHPRRRDRDQPPSKRIVLPALTELQFRGVSEYLEIFVSRIDAPLLDYVWITFFSEVVFDIPQISRLILHQALFMPSDLCLTFYPGSSANISFTRRQERPPDLRYLRWAILCARSDEQMSSIVQLCTHILPLCSSVKSLHIRYFITNPYQDTLDLDPTRWVELFNSFTSVQELEIPEELEPSIAAAFQGLTEVSAAEVLPALQNLSINARTHNVAQRGIKSFVTARQHSNHPVALRCSSRP
jgi:F-box-like